MLTGGGGFKPLTGALRSLPPQRAAMCVPVAHVLDRLSVALDQKPLVRLAFYVYVLLLHIFIVI